MDSIKFFSKLPFIAALKSFFNDLKVPMNYVADEPTTAKDILKDTYKDNDTFQLIDDVYFVGMVDDAAFEGNQSLDVEKIKSDYDGILIFGITLKERPNGLFPTRSQLAEISRAFNREFYYTPVVVVFKYNDHLAFANTERLKYKQEWREGERAGKVSLLRDISIKQPHSGHIRIILELKVPTTGTKRIDSFAALYLYWQEVFSVNVLNKKFYLELSNWYFWAIKHVIFPGKPTMEEAIKKNANIDDLILEHKAINVIRMLTRLLFVWFIKEKKLIPEELFELEILQEKILKDISPYHEYGLFIERSVESIYYKAILQNLFFATLNCPIKADNNDKRSRGFRPKDKNYGVTFLMRYEQYFKDKDAFLELVNSKVPFLNGGLFECLDERGVGEKKDERIWVDGFSDNLPKDQQLIVPDYLFFGLEEETDISDVIGIKDKKYKQAAVKGLINILKSYKFTITENTPIEEDVALDPELLGKVFENLLASYNPETKTTARKQTGSFYTPREIVNYMVDESLIAYLKNAIKDWKELDDETIDKELRILTSFDSKVPFLDHPDDLHEKIITALSICTILDPACGSGAFPMGVLQKMVHMLQKLDPNNEIWKEVQLEKAQNESKAAFEIEDKLVREERLLEINEVFDQSINDSDYARKLYLIENCIYGVDIQPIAIQISKLRFFISLVVEQRVNSNKVNFGIRPLPNLETKFVTANTLIGIEKPSAQLSLYDINEVRILESELKKVRSKLFGAKSKETKLRYRRRDEELRKAIAIELEKSGWKSDTAQKLASWDPYDQNASSTFFDLEWMFDIKDGFDVVIGNPPYVRPRSEDLNTIAYFRSNYETAHNQLDLFHLFIEFAVKNISNKGINSFIISNAFLANENTELLRKFILNNSLILQIVDLKEPVFEGASVDTIVYLLEKTKEKRTLESAYIVVEDKNFKIKHFFNQNSFNNNIRKNFTISLTPSLQCVFDELKGIKSTVTTHFFVTTGIKEYQVGKGNPAQVQLDKDNRVFNARYKVDESYFPELRGKNLKPFNINWKGEHIKYGPWLAEPRAEDFFKGVKILIRKIPNRNRLVLAVCKHDMIVDQSIYLGKRKANSEINEYYAVGVLSGIITNWFFKVFNNETDDLFPQIKTKQFKELPFKSDSLFFKTIIFITKVLHFEINQYLLTVLDALIFNLYFPDHMKERGIDVLEFVERDITAVIQGREWEELDDTEKKKIIEQLHSKWSHPDNEVNNRIKLFAVRSPEILKPILEG